MNLLQTKEDKIKSPETKEPQSLESMTATVLRKVAAESAYRAVLYKILEFCETARSFAVIEQEILSYPEMKTALQSPKVLLSWLVESGGIERIALPAEEEKQEEPTWRTTEAGKNVVRLESPGNRLARLFTQEPVYRDVFLQVLRACVAPKSRGEIEAMLKGNPILESPKVYASFFIEKLEQAGGLEWSEKWQTTPIGKTFMD